MSVNQIIKAAREMREAARYWESGSRIDAEHANWPKNKAAAQRFLDALAAWDRMIESLPKFDDRAAAIRVLAIQIQNTTDSGDLLDLSIQIRREAEAMLDAVRKRNSTPRRPTPPAAAR